MAAAKENKQSYSMILFIAPDGKPMDFHMTPCPQKQALQSLVEVGVSICRRCLDDYRMYSVPAAGRLTAQPACRQCCDWLE